MMNIQYTHRSIDQLDCKTDDFLEEYLFLLWRANVQRCFVQLPQASLAALQIAFLLLSFLEELRVLYRYSNLCCEDLAQLNFSVGKGTNVSDGVQAERPDDFAPHYHGNKNG